MASRKKIVVFTGAGISAESGISTFRDSDGLWAKYRIEDVCTPQALLHNRDTVIEFYNIRRKELLSKTPNAGHYALKKLEHYFDVEIITQNIDDLHERAGSSNVLHLHGELRKLRSSIDENLIVKIEGWKQESEEKCVDGSLLRPYVVFFGESVPMFEKAAEIASRADILIVCGTSLAVYPAASLVRYIKAECPVYVVDPGTPDISIIQSEVSRIQRRSSEGLPDLTAKLIAKYSKPSSCK